MREDDRDLKAFGYAPTLERTLGGFSSFAAGFSYLSILTGMFQMFHYGFAAGGPASFWAWPLVFVGQFAVALCFAELAAHYPLSGSVYQWARRIGSPAVGWLAGWVYLACLVVTLAAVVLALQTTLPQISGVFNVVGDPADPASGAKNAVLLGCGLIVITTAINAIGVRLLALINNAGVFSELLGVIVLIGALGWYAVRGPEVVLDMGGHGFGSPTGYLGPLMGAALMASYIMYGFDTAGTLAEETTEPRRRVPWAILQALGSAAVLGGLVILTALMAAPSVASPELGLATGGLPFIVKAVLGDVFGRAFLLVVLFAIVVCSLAVHTGTVRLVFSMARDGVLPFSGVLAKVSPRTHTPLLPTLLVGLAGAAILIVNVGYPQIIGAVASIAIVWANLAYLFVTVPLLRMRLAGWPRAGGSANIAAPLPMAVNVTS
jgi:urea carboxylase system permease